MEWEHENWKKMIIQSLTYEKIDFFAVGPFRFYKCILNSTELPTRTRQAEFQNSYASSLEISKHEF